MPSPVVGHIWIPSGTSLLTTLHVKCVVFRRKAHHEDSKETSVCVLKVIELEIRQVAWLAR